MNAEYNKTLYVAIDIGKNVHWLGAYAGFELADVQSACKLPSNQSGFKEVTAQLDEWLTNGRYEQVVLGHEPTGIYHENWAWALMGRYEEYGNGRLQPYLDYRFLNPLLVKRKRDVLSNGRRRKNDPLDLIAISHCLRDGSGYPAYLPAGDELRLVLWARRYRQLHRQQRRLGLRVLSQLDQLWPGLIVDVKRFAKMHSDLQTPVPLVLSKPLSRQTVQAILQHCPNPHHLRALGQAGIQAFFRQHVGRCGPVTAGRAFNIVTQAVLPPPDVADLLAEQRHLEAQQYRSLSRQLQQLEVEVEALVPHTPAAVLSTIPGVSPFLAARYLAYLKAHRRFTTPAEVWAFAGFDPVTQESGDYRRLGKISRKGHPGLRDTLFLIGLHTARHIPAIGRVRQKALARGKGHVGATLHAAHKANRLCHRLLFDQLPFDPQRSR